MSPLDKPSSNRPLLRGGMIWSRRGGTFLVILAALLVIALVIVWTTSGTYLAGRTAAFLNRAVFGEDTRIAMKKVGGFPLGDLVLEGFRLEKKGPEGWYPFVSADRMRVRYDPWALLHGRYELDRVDASGLHVELREAGGGTYLLPSTRSRPGKKRGHGPRFRLGKLVVADSFLRVDLPWRALQLDSLRGEFSLQLQDERFRISVKQVQGTQPENLGNMFLEGGAFLAGKEFTMEKVRGRWGRASFVANGRPAGEHQDLTLTVRRFPLERLGRFLREKNLDRGWVDSLWVRFQGREGDTSLRWKGSGSWEQWRVRDSEGRGRVTRAAVSLWGVKGTVNGARVTEGRLDIPLHDTSLTASGRFAGVHLEALPVEIPPPYAGTGNGRGVVSLSDRSRPEEGGKVRLDLDAGDFLGIAFRRAVIAMRMTPKAWSLDTAQVSLEGAELSAAGDLGPDTLDLAVRYRGDLRPWRRFLKRGDLAGVGTVDATVRGSRICPELDAEASIDGFTMAQIHAPRLSVPRLWGTLGETGNLHLNLVAERGLTVGKIPLSRAEGRMTLVRDSLWVESLRLVRGDTSATVTGSVRWRPRVEVRIRKARVHVEGRQFLVEGFENVTFADSVLTCGGVRVRTPRGAIQVQGTWNVHDQRLHGRLDLDGLDYSVFLPADTPPSVRIGSMDGTVTLSGVVPAVDVGGDLVMKAVEWDGGRLDSLRTAFTVEGPTVRIRNLEGFLAGGSMAAAGTIRLPASLYETMEAIAVGPDPDPEKILWDLDGSASNVKLGPWFAFVKRSVRPAGRVDLQGSLRGSAASPRLGIRGVARGLIWQRFEADSLVLSAELAEGAVSVDTVAVWQHGKRIEAHGNVPLDLALYPFAWNLPEREIDLRLTAGNGCLEGLRLTPWIQDAKGNLKADIRVFGTPRKPLLQGTAEVSGAEIRPADRDEVLKNVRARIRFERDLVSVEQADALLEGGKVHAEGTYRLPGEGSESYELKIRADKAVVRESGVYAARVSGDVTLRPRVAADGRTYPFAEGNIFVHRAEYAGSLEPQDIGRFEPQPILYSVRINAPNSIFIITQDVDVELGGEVTVRQDVSSQSILGEMDIIRGTYQLFLEKFRINEGTLQWNDPSNPLPEMDINAETKSAGYLILVDLTGRVDKPVISFSAQSLEDDTQAALTQGEIIQLLAVGSIGLTPETVGLRSGEPASDANTPGTIERGLVGASNLFKNPLERALVRKLGIVDEIEINAGFAENKIGASVGVRKWVTPELSIRYRQGLSRMFEQDLAVEYRLRRALFLRGEVLRRQQQSSVEPTQQFNLDLRVRREY